MSGKKIETDEQYRKSLEWMREKAVQIEDPLLDEIDRDKLQRTYDYVSRTVSQYQRDVLGYKVTEHHNDYAAVEPSAKRQPESQPKKRSSFLDDDDD